MSKSKPGLISLLGPIDSDSDDIRVEAVAAMPTPDTTAEDIVPVKRGRGRPKAATTKAAKVAKVAKVTKAKPTGRRASGAKAASSKRGKRAPLTDKTNEQNASNDTEEVEEFDQQEVTMDIEPSRDELDASTVVVKQQKSPTAKSRSTRKNADSVKDVSIRAGSSVPPDAPDISRLGCRAPAAARKLNQGKYQASTEPNQHTEVIHETQVPMVDVSDNEDEEVRELTLMPFAHRTTVAPSASRSMQTSMPRRRAGSTSETERSDPAIRRRLGELTMQLEKLDIKYRKVREIGIQEAERNFERLKRQSEESAKVANELIASLKADLAAQSAQAKDSKELMKTIEMQTAEISKLQTKVAQLTSSLTEAQTENKTLSTKLAANRTAAASVESINGWAPGSAAKPNRGVIMMGSVEVAQAAQVAQLKEDLYSDLTGLIILSVKREAEEDVYDCIQTGRNGTLHFKLAVANEKTAGNYDDAHCIYIPQLDPSRDKPLIEILPEYLVEEITFPRPHAAKFYDRVMKALKEKQP